MYGLTDIKSRNVNEKGKGRIVDKWEVKENVKVQYEKLLEIYPRLAEMKQGNVSTLIAATCQLGKTHLAMAVIWVYTYMYCLKCIYICPNRKSVREDVINKMNAFNTVITDPKLKLNAVTVRPKTIGHNVSCASGDIVVSLSNSTSLEKINNAMQKVPKHYKTVRYAVIIDEADVICHDESPKTSIKNEKEKRKLLVQRINGQPCIAELVLITATTYMTICSSFFNIQKTLQMTSQDVVYPNTRYIDIHIYKHKEWKVDNSIRSFSTLEAKDKKLPLEDILSFHSEIQPAIVLIKLSNYIADHNAIANFVVKRVQNVNVFVINDSKISRVTSEGVRVEKSKTPQQLLQTLKNQKTREPIFIIGGSMIDRGITFMSSDYGWALTHMIYHPSRTTTQCAIQQELGRLNGHYNINSPIPTLYCTNETYKTAIDCYENENRIQNRALVSRDIIKEMLESTLLINTDKKFHHADPSTFVNSGVELRRGSQPPRHITSVHRLFDREWDDDIKAVLRDGNEPYKDLIKRHADVHTRMMKLLRDWFHIPKNKRLHLCLSNARAEKLNQDYHKKQTIYQSDYIALNPNDMNDIVVIKYDEIPIEGENYSWDTTQGEVKYSATSETVKTGFIV